MIPIKTFKEWDEFLGQNFYSFTRWGNTKVRRGTVTNKNRESISAIKIRLYDTDIVTFTERNQIILNSGGYYTQTTRRRMTEVTPFTVHSVKNTWYVSDGQEEWRFFDGMILEVL